jgi:SAM-dependent methyltransferase
MPLEVIRAVGPPEGARVLEVGAGGGQLTWALVEAGYDVTALEPNTAMRERGAARAPAARFVASTFEGFDADGRFDAILSANAFHWVDPDVGLHKAAAMGDELILIWNTPFIRDPELQRRVQEDVLRPRASTFPAEEAGIRAHVADEIEANIGRFHESGCFGEPRTHLHERVLRYTPQRYRDLVGSFGKIASSPERADILAELGPVLGDDPIDVIDIVWVIAARAA